MVNNLKFGLPSQSTLLQYIFIYSHLRDFPDLPNAEGFYFPFLNSPYAALRPMERMPHSSSIVIKSAGSLYIAPSSFFVLPGIIFFILMFGVKRKIIVNKGIKQCQIKQPGYRREHQETGNGREEKGSGGEKM